MFRYVLLYFAQGTRTPPLVFVRRIRTVPTFFFSWVDSALSKLDLIIFDVARNKFMK